MKSTGQLILDLESARYSAMLSGDVGTLAELLDNELTYTDSSGRVDNKATYLKSFGDGVRKYLSIERTELNVVMRAGIGLVFCKLHIVANFKGAPREVRTRALAAWVFQDSRWTLLALQSSPDSAT